MFISVDLKSIYNLQSVRTEIRLADAQVVAMRYGAIPSSASKKNSSYALTVKLAFILPEKTNFRKLPVIWQQMHSDPVFGRLPILSWSFKLDAITINKFQDDYKFKIIKTL